MKRPESLIVVGSSGSGKTTLVDGLRVSEFTTDIVIPRRFITRRERQRDNNAENSHISNALFSRGTHTGLISPWWERKMDGGRIERYGFVALSGDRRLPVYSANNAFLTSPNGNSRLVAEKGLIIIIKAAREVREARLLDRSPDMTDAERAVRLADEGPRAADFRNSLEIDTTDLDDLAGQLILHSVVRYVIA